MPCLWAKLCKFEMPCEECGTSLIDEKSIFSDNRLVFRTEFWYEDFMV